MNYSVAIRDTDDGFTITIDGGPKRISASVVGYGSARCAFDWLTRTWPGLVFLLHPDLVNAANELFQGIGTSPRGADHEPEPWDQQDDTGPVS